MVRFAGTPDSLEQRLVEAAGIAFVGFAARGLNRRKPWTFPATALTLLRGRQDAKRWLRQLGPDAVATFGGYASLPVGLAASAARLPLLVHEQNARSGLANRVLAGRADILAISDERTRGEFKGSAEVVYTGNPLRAELFGVDREQARRRLGFSEAGRLLLVFGGSLGAHHVNEAVLGIAGRLLDEFDDLEVLHLTGSGDHAWVGERLAGLGLAEGRWRIQEYMSEMGDAYAAADLVLSRAGATSLAELTALGKAALLVPYPYGAADEQAANADRLASIGAAAVWPDSDLALPGFYELTRGLIADAKHRDDMAAQARTLGKPGATEAIAALILELAGS
jgi:UDP-N-acetylglucosamine--N-acetylmuramyl-(pentapeptide) pyrophosphoryl-undecaprenol N-acetylglucosamine transferase